MSLIIYSLKSFQAVITYVNDILYSHGRWSQKNTYRQHTATNKPFFDTMETWILASSTKFQNIYHNSLSCFLQLNKLFQQFNFLIISDSNNLGLLILQTEQIIDSRKILTMQHDKKYKLLSRSTCEAA